MARETLVVNCFGGPGAGKTTAAWHIASELKKKGLVVEYVPEYAKELVWDKRMDLLDGSYDNQVKLADEQEHRLKRLCGQVDIIVTDSPLLLNALYLKPQNKQEGVSYTSKIAAKFKQYHNFCLVVERGKTFEIEGRIHSEGESKEKDREIVALLDNQGIFYGRYSHMAIDTAIENCIKTYHRISGPKRMPKKLTDAKDVAAQRNMSWGSRILMESLNAKDFAVQRNITRKATEKGR